MEKIICVQVGVDCVKNNHVEDYEGIPYLGFDFYVPLNDSKEIISFINETLLYFSVPVINVGIVNALELNSDELHTKDKIFNTIKENAEFLKIEEKRNQVHTK